MNYHPDTLAVHGADISDANAAAVSSPIYLSTTFERSDDGSIGRHLYSRYSNPNRDAFEAAMCLMESGTVAFAFSSGLAAAMAIFQTLEPGDHIVVPDDTYYGVVSQLDEIFQKFGLTFTRVDYTNPDEVAGAINLKTKFVWTESPSNPLVKITDLKHVAEIAHSRNALVVCDNTWATPILQRPLELGCDVVFHSATKYIGGHSDILLGVVIVNDNETLSQKLKRVQMVGGAVPSPFECWLASRGLQTLPVRVRAQSLSAQRIAEHFKDHPHIERVLYPSLPEHHGHEIALRQMSMPGAMMSLLVRGSGAETLRVACNTKIFAHATSLGGVESLIEHRASVEPANSKTPSNLLRLSIGLEFFNDLINDIEQALEVVFGAA